MIVLGLLAELAAPAWPTAVVLPPPVPAAVVPAWTVVPGAPLVFYAPNIPGDCFRFKHRYYYYHNGVWYRSRHLDGPWHPVRKLPRAIRVVPSSLFKTAPAPW